MKLQDEKSHLRTDINDLELHLMLDKKKISSIGSFGLLRELNFHLCVKIYIYQYISLLFNIMQSMKLYLNFITKS